MPRDHENAFQYQCLAKPASEIRLLRLNTTDLTQSFEPRCELTAWRLDGHPDYVAASYTWGNINNTALIYLNERPSAVGRNWYSLLEQAFRHGIHGHLWIDAICINQNDDDEKSVQVAMMGNIYRTAKTVYIFSGPHENDSSRLFDLADRYTQYVDNTLRSTQRSGDLHPILLNLQKQNLIPDDLHMLEPGYKAEMKSISRRGRGPLFAALDIQSFFKDLTDADAKESLQALYDFSERRYFSRLWNVQEILLGRTVMLLCGDSCINFNDFADFIEAIETYGRDAEIGMPFGGKSRHLDFLTGVWTAAGNGLYQLTDLTSEFQCFDIRDRIYGILGLVDWQGYEPIKVDYKKSPLALALETIAYMCPLKGPADASNEPLWSNDERPAVSATRIAIALDLHSDHAAIQDLLRSRRQDAVTSCKASAYDKPKKTKSRIRAQAEGYCRLFESSRPEADFESCMVRSDALETVLEGI